MNKFEIIEDVSDIPYVLSAAIDLFSIAGYTLLFDRVSGFTIKADEDTNYWRVLLANKDNIILQYNTFTNSLLSISYKFLDDGEILFDLQVSGISKFNGDMLDTLEDYTFSCIKPKELIEE
jgi:hypothetical protein